MVLLVHMTNLDMQSLLNKELSRKEFLGIIVLMVGSLIGLSSAIKLFTGKTLENKIPSERTNNVYGR